VHEWARENEDLIVQTCGVAKKPPVIDLEEESHSTIRKALDEFLDVRKCLQRRL